MKNPNDPTTIGDILDQRELDDLKRGLATIGDILGCGHSIVEIRQATEQIYDNLACVRMERANFESQLYSLHADLASVRKERDALKEYLHADLASVRAERDSLAKKVGDLTNDRIVMIRTREDHLIEIARSFGTSGIERRPSILHEVGSIIEAITRLQDEVAVFRGGVDKTAVARDQWKERAERAADEEKKWWAAMERIADALGWGHNEILINTDNIIAAIKDRARMEREAGETRDRHFNALTQANHDLAECHEFMENVREVLGEDGEFDDFAASAEVVLGLILDGRGEDDSTSDVVMARVFESLHTVVATSPRDWSKSDPEAWIYGIVCGWGDALDGVAKARCWSPAAVARIKELRTAVESVSGV